MKKLQQLILTSLIALFPLYVTASPGQQQSNIANDCITQHSLESDPLVQKQIEDTCSADNASSQFTTADMLSALIHSGLIRTSDIKDWEGYFKIFSSSSLDSPTQSSINAGELFGNVAVWGSFNWNTVDNEFVNTPFDSAHRVAMIGADVRPMDNFIAGLTFGYEDNDVSTAFNTGSQDIDGYTIAGYMAYLINNNFSLDATVGHSDLDIEQDRLQSLFGFFAGPFAGVAPGTLITSDVDADRLFAAINLNAYGRMNNWILGGHAGYLWAEEDHDSFIESGGGVTSVVASRDFELGQFRIGFDIAYDWQSFLEPYFGVDYLHDTTREDVVVAPGLLQPENDDDEFLFTLGMRYFSDFGLTGNIEYNISSGREDIDASTIMMILRYDL